MRGRNIIIVHERRNNFELTSKGNMVSPPSSTSDKYNKKDAT